MTAAFPYDDLPLDPDELFAHILDPQRRRGNLVRLYHQLRSVAPVFQANAPQLGNPFIITRFADMEQVVREKRLVKDGRLVTQLGGDPDSVFVRVMKRMLAFIDGERHTRLRLLINKGFTLRSVEQLRPGVRKLVHSLIDSRMDAGGMDVVSDYAFRIPMTMICELLGVPVDDVPRIEASARGVTQRSDEGLELTPAAEDLGNRSMQDFVELFRDLIEARRARPRDDLISRLVEIQREAEDLTDDDIIATSVLLFQAGHDTTANMIAKGTLALIRNPDQLELLRARPDLIKHATEELLRYDTPVQISVNYAIDDVPFHDRTIRDDTGVILVRGAANRDPARFVEPDRLDFERSDVQHHSFGMGQHFCLGASLARLEIQEAVSALVERVPDMRLDVDDPPFRPHLHLHGLESLPVSW